MNAKCLSQPVLNVLSLLFLLFSVALVATGQGKADIEVKVQTASDIARGGEAFPYTVTVTNLGSVKASDVVLLTRTSVSFFQLVSGQSTKGSCSKTGDYSEQVLRCTIGDLLPGESVVVDIQAKLEEVGDRSESEEQFGPNGEIYGSTGPPPPPPPPSKKGSMNESPKILQVEAGTNNSVENATAKGSGTNLASIHAFANNDNDDFEKNRVTLAATVLPSRNIPPRVQIVSPQEGAIITRPARKPTAVVFTIKAFDPDGTIESVNVSTQQFKISVEYPENRIVVDGKFYSIKEFQENKETFQKYIGGEATRTGKDTYTFTLENPQYGMNRVFVDAIDNGKRYSGTSVGFTVKGDNSIEWVNPIQDSVVAPGTNLILSTKIKLNEGPMKSLHLIGPQLCCGEPPQMKLVSKNSVYHQHQYVWKNIQKGYYSFQVFLTEESGAFTYSDFVSFKVTVRPLVRITSLKNGQVFKQGEKIPIEIVAIDPDGEIKDVSVPVDGEYDRYFSWNDGGFAKSGYVYGLMKGTHIIQAKVKDDLDVETVSTPITIIVK